MIELPYGLADFRRIRQQGMVYIDRTDYLRVLERLGSTLVFLRPRRFGKSLWLQTLANYYDLRRAGEFSDLFGGLAAGREPTPLANRYFVLQLNFSVVDPSGSVEQIAESLREHVRSRATVFVSDYEGHLPGPVETKGKPEVVLSSLLAAVRKTPHSLYLLVDDYDSPFNEAMERELISPGRINDPFRLLFKLVKSAMEGQGLERVFITGVSPAALNDLRDGFNVAKNISREPEVSGLCGFQEGEIRGLLQSTAHERALSPQEIETAVEAACTRHNSYRFTDPPNDETELVYNSTDVLRFVEHVSRHGARNLGADRLRLDFLATIAGPRTLEKVTELSRNTEAPQIAAMSFSRERTLRFDVFLSHTSADKPVVELLAHRLRDLGLKPFLDRWDHIPGEPWQPALAGALHECGTCAVFLGETLGAWQINEVQLALNRNAQDRSFRVIPVLLPGGRAPDEEEVPGFLSLLGWVDFRDNLDDEDTFRQLVAGIQGLAPGPGPSQGGERSWSTRTVFGGTEAHAVDRMVAATPPSVADLVSERAHSDETARELSRLRQKRLSSPDEARRQAKELAERARTGDLRCADRSVKARVLELAARLHAGSRETLDEAKGFRDQLLEIAPTASTVIIDALIQATEGNIDTSLRMLRDQEAPETRGLFFGFLANHREDATALEWFDSQDGRNDPHFFAGLGWYNLAMALAQAGGWEESCDYLAKASEYQDDTPDLLYREGIVNAAMLLSPELRDLALFANLPPTSVIEGPSTEKYRARALTCFRRAQEVFASIDPTQATAAKRWMFWLLLTDPDPREQQSAVAEVTAQLENPSRGVSILPVAHMFGVPFDTEQYWKHLELREKQGGLDGEEIHAHFILAKLRLSPKDFYLFLEEEENRLGRLFSASSLVSERMSAVDARLIS